MMQDFNKPTEIFGVKPEKTLSWALSRQWPEDCIPMQLRVFSAQPSLDGCLGKLGNCRIPVHEAF